MADRYALLSVSDKSGLAEFASRLHKSGFKLISTGNSAKAIRQAGIPVQEVREFTGQPEILDGRVKTIHPKIYSGILFRRDNPKHEAQAECRIDLVCVNFYPFEKTVAGGASLADAIENIDIGGPGMVRAAAKNYEGVLVVTSPSQYDEVCTRIVNGNDNLEFRQRLARAAFDAVSSYDVAISGYFRSIGADSSAFPQELFLRLSKISDLRYGENPHQKAALYRTHSPSFSDAVVHQGKQLSYNNIIDAQAALEMLNDFRAKEERPFAVIFKHANPCGAAQGSTPLEAYRKAYAADSLSAFGGIVGLNKPCDKETAQEITKTFMEIVLAPAFSPDALEVFKAKPNLRVLDISAILGGNIYRQIPMRSVTGGFLAQTPDFSDNEADAFKVVSRRQPTKEEWAALRFAWKLVKQPKSNAVVFATSDQMVACGVGQQSRVDSCHIAVEKAKRAKLEIKGTAMASDAFFPFRDTVEFAAQAGCTAVIQPGGSIRDAEVIAAADELNLAMVFTGVRHFRH
ncbi:MAG: bifunctional phosphoribosylaminoimidazolecarboxamide formyltransferase/IMP cyclohydrolase [Candidatus Micrarchaeota archaeon]